jgi:membrane protease YdiL (CAAX protease family)
VVVIERQPLTSIGVRKLKLWDVTLAILAGLIAFFGIGLVYSLLLPALHVKTSTGTATASGIIALPIWLRLAIVIRAAVVEEVIWRGYGLERLSSLTGSRPFAAFLTLAGFTYAHLAGWGAAHLIAAGFAGLIITLFYLWRRNLVAAMIAHGVTDALALVVLPLFSSLQVH